MLLDGTFWTDDEPIRARISDERALQMGHVPVDGPEGSLRWLAELPIRHRMYIHVNNTIPIKDAHLLARCPLREVRRVWIQRILDHDGNGDDPGGIENWLRLGEAVGISREEMASGRRILPAVQYSVDAYVDFVATQPWIQGVASSLTELFSPGLMKARLEALEKLYPWIEPAGLVYFRTRLTQAGRDCDHGLSLVLAHCRTRAEQEQAVATLRFKCDVLWAQLDAIHYHCIR